LQEIDEMRRTIITITALNDLTNIELVATNVVKIASFNTCADCVRESHGGAELRDNAQHLLSHEAGC
jgi:hypothetical protein